MSADNSSIFNHPSLKAQRFELETIHQEIKSQKASTLPRVELEVEQRLRNLRHGRNSDPTVRVLLEWNFFDLGNRYTTQSYIKKYEASLAREQRLQEDLTSRAAMALSEMNESRKQIEAAEEQIGASSQVVDMYALQFRIGRRSLIELLNANNELALMEMTKVNSKNDYRSAMLELMHARALLKNWAQGRAAEN